MALHGRRPERADHPLRNRVQFTKLSDAKWLDKGHHTSRCADCGPGMAREERFADSQVSNHHHVRRPNAFYRPRFPIHTHTIAVTKIPQRTAVVTIKPRFAPC